MNASSTGIVHADPLARTPGPRLHPYRWGGDSQSAVVLNAEIADYGQKRASRDQERKVPREHR